MSVIDKNTTFLGYRRENGRVGVRNHVIILPLDDLSNAAAEAVAHNIKGAMAIPHPYGRLQFGADLDLHFRTLIGAGCNPNVAAVVVIGIEDGWTKKVVDGIATTGKPVCGFGIEGHGDHDTILRASKAAREYVQWASEKQREVCPIHELWVSTKCGESDTTSGCGANPTVGNAFDKLYETGNYLVFGETSEITGGEKIVAERCRTPEIRDQFMFMFNRYQDMINRHKTSDLSDSQPTKGNIAGGLTTIEEKSAGQYSEDRQKVRGGRRDRQGRNAHPSRPVVYGFLQRRCRDGHAVRCVGFCGAFLPHRPRQCDRQPHRAGDQNLRQPAHRASDERACGRGQFGPFAARNLAGPGGRHAAGEHAAHCERPLDRCGSIGSP